jgi:hypothetical protein
VGRVQELATVGLAGGLVTASDVLAHRVLGRTPSVVTTLMIDVTAGAGMAAGTLIRRNLRAKRYGWVQEDRQAVARVRGPKALATIGAISLGTAGGIAALAVAEQTAARGIYAGLEKVIGSDLGETGTWVAHSITGLGMPRRRRGFGQGQATHAAHERGHGAHTRRRPP